MGPKAIKHVNITILFSQHQPFLVFPQLISIFSFYNNSVRGFTEQTSMKLIFHSHLVIDGMLIAHFHQSGFFLLWLLLPMDAGPIPIYRANEINLFLACISGCLKVVFWDQFFPNGLRILWYTRLPICKHPSSIYN